jgi:hypothetical protein
MVRRVAALFGTAFAAAMALGAPARAQLIPFDSQFQLNSYTPNYQGAPALAVDDSGIFVVVWQSDGSTGSDTLQSSIQGGLYTATGIPLGPDFQVNTYTTNSQYLPSVAHGGSGSFVVAWHGYGSSGSDSDDSSIHARRFYYSSPLGAEFQVNTYTTSRQYGSSVGIGAYGSVVVVWTSDGSPGSDTSGYSIQGQRYDFAGAVVGGQFQVNTYTTASQYGAHVAANVDGSFVVVWASYGSAGSDNDLSSIQAQRYDATGSPAGSEFQVNTHTTGFALDPRVAIAPNGSFVVVWESTSSSGSDTSGKSVQARLFDATGAPLGAEFQVNTYTTLAQDDPDVAIDQDRDFVVTWESYGSPGTDSDNASIQGQQFDAAGTPVGGQFQVNTYTTSGQYNPRITADWEGNFLVAWGSSGGFGSDTDNGSIEAQRYAIGRPILGRRLLVKNPTGAETGRTVMALGRETGTDFGLAILGDPTQVGATLRVIANGTTDSDQTYLLDASGWTNAFSLASFNVGYRYDGPTGGDGDPVKKVILKRTAAGTAVLKAIIKGGVGTQSLDVVPPNLGDDGGIILQIPGGGTYCIALGGATGSREVKDDATQWTVISASLHGCPTP